MSHKTRTIIDVIKAAGEKCLKNTSDINIDIFLKENLLSIEESNNWLSEELSANTSELDSTYSGWIVDPIDGTLEYEEGKTLYSISCAYYKNGEIVHSVVYAPRHNTLIAYSDGQHLECIDPQLRNRFSNKIFYTENEQLKTPPFVNSYKRSYDKTPGSIALKLALSSASVSLGVVNMVSKNIWDVAAAFSLCQKRGLIITDRDKKDILPLSPEYDNGIILIGEQNA